MEEKCVYCGGDLPEKPTKVKVRTRSFDVCCADCAAKTEQYIKLDKRFKTALYLLVFLGGIGFVISAFFGGLPTATYSQNVGIVSTTKVTSRRVMGTAAVILLAAGLIPKFSSLLTTIPYCVLGGATISVFASIAMTGMKLIASEELNFRNTTIVGLAIAVGMGVTQASASLAQFPDWVTTIFGKSPVVLATISAIFLNLILPKQIDPKTK